MAKKPHEVDLLSDTSRQAERIQFEIIRKKTPAEKLKMVGELNSTMRILMLSGIEMRHPEFNEQQRHRKLMDQLLGEVLAATVFGPPVYSCNQKSDTEN